MEIEVVSADGQIVKKGGAKVRHLVGIALVLTASLSSSVAQLSNGESPPPNERKHEVPPADPGMLARNLVGNRVQNNRGDELGVVSDLLINPRSSRVEYIVISTGGFAKIGRKLKPIPPGMLSTATAMRGVLAADISLERWRTAPTFTRASLLKLGDQAGRRIYDYYQQTWPVQTAQAGTKPAPSISQSDVNGALKFGSDLIGRLLQDRQGRKVGRISDLLIQLGNPQTSFAIIRPGLSLTGPDKPASRQFFATPLKNLKESAGSEKLILDATPAQFQQARPLENSTWTTAPLAGAPKIFRYQPGEQSENRGLSILTQQ